MRRCKCRAGSPDLLAGGLDSRDGSGTSWFQRRQQPQAKCLAGTSMSGHRHRLVPHLFLPWSMTATRRQAKLGRFTVVTGVMRADGGRYQFAVGRRP